MNCWTWRTNATQMTCSSTRNWRPRARRSLPRRRSRTGWWTVPTTPPAAFEQLLAARFRAGLREHSDTALTDSAVGLVAAAAVELAATLGGNSVFADSTRGGSDLLMGVAHAAGEQCPRHLSDSGRRRRRRPPGASPPAGPRRGRRPDPCRCKRRVRRPWSL